MTIVSQSDSVESRLDRIEHGLSKITDALEQAPAMLSMATDTIDEQVSAQRAQGVDIEERLQTGLQLLGRLSEPGIAQSLHGLLDLVEQGPGLVSMAADSIDESLYQANQGSVPLAQRLQSASRLLNRLTDDKQIDKINQLLDLSDQLPGLVSMTVDTLDEFMIDGGGNNVELFNKVLAANKYATESPPAKVGGIFSILKLMRDKDISRATGFLVNFLKAFGRKL